jgi:V/A-type H+/Na+-transporting ATPase subunit F
MKIAVLTDPESAAGYRLGGLEVAAAQDEAEAREVLARLIKTEDYALIIVNMTLLADPYQAVKREMHGRDLPVLLPAPVYRAAVGVAGEDAEKDLRQMIRETMGYDIKLEKSGDGRGPLSGEEG